MKTLKLQVRQEVNKEIHDLELNILGYQELLKQKEEALQEICRSKKEHGGASNILLEELKGQLAEKTERIMYLESQVSKHGGGVDKHVSDRLYKKVEQLNHEVERRLEKIHEHYQVKWKAKAEDFINELAEHKARINVLIEENGRLSSMGSAVEEHGAVNAVKKLLAAKEEELTRLRGAYQRLEGDFGELRCEMSQVDQRCEKRLNDLRCDYDLLCAKLKEEHALELVEIRGGLGSMEEVRRQRDEHACRLTELHQFIEDLKCKHCKELQSSHREVYYLQTQLAEHHELMKTCGEQARKDTECRLLLDACRRQLVEKEATFRRERAELLSEVETCRTEKRCAVEECQFELAGEVCVLREMLLCKNKDYDKLCVRLEALELEASSQNISSEEIAAVFKQQMQILEEQNRRECGQWKA